jgi:predicted double-glycine peptidase
VPDYSAKLEDQITKTAKANDKLYIDMLDDGPDKRTYDQYKEKYNDIEADINSIYLLNEARNDNNNLLVITNTLKPAFQEAKQYHKDNKTLSDGEIKAYKSTLAGFWKPLYLAERGLKINSN